jgi:outer membrane lipoprotein
MDIPSTGLSGFAIPLAWRSQAELSRWLGYLLLTACLAGCATSPFPKEFRQAAKQQPSLAEISAHPEAFKGRTVLLGGTIVETTNQPKTTEIEILQKPLTRYDDRPQETDQSSGRFLARCQGFLDSAVYAKGREITVAGEVQGREVRQIDQVQYPYPIISCKKVHLWPNRPSAAYAYPYPYWYGPYGYGFWGRGWGYPYWYPYW